MEWTKDFDKGIFLVNVLAVIYNPETRMLLIGRRENDPHVANLSWVFPGGRPDYEKDLEENVAEIVKAKTGLEVEVKNIVFAKTYPEKRNFLSVYYFTEVHVIGGEETPSDDLKELKWIKPSEVDQYFTTSLHPKLHYYLKTLD